MQSPDASRPVLLLIDVEPDDRKTKAGQSGWESSEAAFDRLESLRTAFAAATGRSVRYNWFFRCDPQIEKTFGRADFVAEACPRIVHSAKSGDDAGVHVHLWKWSATLNRWYNDLDNRAWIDECLATSIAAFERIFGKRPRIARFGDRWLSNQAVEAMRAAGIRYDLTVEPGFPGEVIHDDPHATGSMPDFRGAPREPFRPVPGQYLAARTDRRMPDDFWMIPLTTTQPGWRLVRRAPLLMRASRSPNLALSTSYVWPHLRSTLNRPSRSPVVIVFRSGDLSNPHFLANFERTTRLLARHPALAWCEFITVEDAITRWIATEA